MGSVQWAIYNKVLTNNMKDWNNIDNVKFNQNYSKKIAKKIKEDSIRRCEEQEYLLEYYYMAKDD